MQGPLWVAEHAETAQRGWTVCRDCSAGETKNGGRGDEAGVRDTARRAFV